MVNDLNSLSVCDKSDAVQSHTSCSSSMLAFAYHIAVSASDKRGKSETLGLQADAPSATSIA